MSTRCARAQGRSKAPLRPQVVVKIKKELADEWIEIWYIYTMDYYSAIKRNKIKSFVEMWMDLESVIQSKNKYCILMHICGIWKDVQMKLFAGQE